MFRNRLLTVGLRASVPHREGLRRTAVNYAGARRRHASSAATEITDHNVRQKTMEDLGGPSFLTTLNWLFLKGYLPKTQQMQVSGARACTLRACLFIHSVFARLFTGSDGLVEPETRAQESFIPLPEMQERLFELDVI